MTYYYICSKTLKVIDISETEPRATTGYYIIGSNKTYDINSDVTKLIDKARNANHDKTEKDDEGNEYTIYGNYSGDTSYTPYFIEGGK